MHALAKFIYFKILGWKLIGSFPQLDKCVVIVVPHTSWVDFLLGLLIRKVLNEDIHFIGKKALFRPPFGWYFRWMGGAPIDRSKNMDTVSGITKIFDQNKTFRLALSPEGTRKKVAEWRTGFYFIAKSAQGSYSNGGVRLWTKTDQNFQTTLSNGEQGGRFCHL